MQGERSRVAANQRPSDAISMISAGSAASIPYCRFIWLRSRVGLYLSAATAPIAPTAAQSRVQLTFRLVQHAGTSTRHGAANMAKLFPGRSVSECMAVRNWAMAAVAHLASESCQGAAMTIQDPSPQPGSATFAAGCQTT